MKFLKYAAIIILLLVVVFLGMGLLTPSISYENTITIDKPVKEAWAVMADESKLPDWIDGYKRMEHVSGIPNTVGAVSNVYIEDRGEEMIMKETITALQPNKKMAMTFTADFMNMDYEMNLEEKEGKTYIVTKSTTTGNGMISKSMISLMKSAMEAQEDKNLYNLKNVVEANTTNYFPESVVDSLSLEKVVTPVN